MRIKNSQELRSAYKLLQIYRSFGAAGCPKAAELKREIRSFHHLPHSSRIINDRGIDGYVELTLLPSCFDTWEEQDVGEWFERSCALRAIPSQFDCTGQAFTNWFKLVRRRGHWFAYHSVSFDV